jgi:uncharacterized protein (DUF362 family)
MLRRCFLRSLAAPAAGLSFSPCLKGQEAEGFRPGEGSNRPVGAGKGIHPGRVVWVRDTNATKWDGATGRWWDDSNTNQGAVHGMGSRLLQELTGSRNDKQAWDALFRNFNENHGRGTGSYKPGERIAIKVNCNQDRAAEWGTGNRPLNGLPSPHAVVTLVTQLIESAGVRGEDILVYDACGQRNVGQPITTRVRGSSNAQFQAVKFLAGTDFNQGGRLTATPDMANAIRFAKSGVPSAYLPQAVTEATYMINVALLRPHTMAGITLTAKNHFGSIHFPSDGGWSPRALHNYIQRTVPMGSYSPLVDLTGHPHLGGKTMLYLLDGLYTAEHNEANVIRWSSFGDQWGASLLISQDPVAIDSVGLDILRSEPRATQVKGSVDNYLHEAAQAAKPPSGLVYEPGSRGPLASLGVHEHWNNASERKYTRNLGGKEGIELIARV